MASPFLVPPPVRALRRCARCGRLTQNGQPASEQRWFCPDCASCRDAEHALDQAAEAAT